MFDLVNFLHKCEVTISEEDLGTFLDMAKNLKINNRISDSQFSCNMCRISDSQFSCNMCTKEYTNRGTLWQHKTSAHEGVRYSCDQCNSRSFTMADKLRRHKARAHEGVRYPCDQCDLAPFT